MITIDGSYGEGGGQILRTSLSLSLITGKPFCIQNIRAGRKKPGLLRQHLTCVQAAQSVGNATVIGDSLSSQQLTFVPQQIAPGEYSFSVGTAGSTGLVFQTILPALVMASGPSTIELRGGTHNPFAPPFPFFDKCLFPILQSAGCTVTGVLHQYGFYPAGGGHVTYHITPTAILKPISLTDPGQIHNIEIVSTVANIGRRIAEREITATQKAFPLAKTQVQQVTNSIGPGNTLSIRVKNDAVTEVFTTFGMRAVSAEKVALSAVRLAKEYIDSNACVGSHLADQLMLWLALTGKGAYTTTKPTQHSLTQAKTIREFLDCDIRIEQQNKTTWLVTL